MCIVACVLTGVLRGLTRLERFFSPRNFYFLTSNKLSPLGKIDFMDIRGVFGILPVEGIRCSKDRGLKGTISPNLSFGARSSDVSSLWDF